jgi:integrase/recombinase XerD
MFVVNCFQQDTSFIFSLLSQTPLSIITLNLKPHDLRRHAATYASRSGTPLEIVSKVILRHADLATTQRYLGNVSDIEAIRWIENLHG